MVFKYLATVQTESYLERVPALQSMTVFIGSL